MFEQTFVQAGVTVRRPWTMAASLTIQTGMVGVLLLLPLIYTEQLQFRRLADIFTAPTPPPPVAPKFEPAKMTQAAKAPVSQFAAHTNTLMLPVTVPKRAAIIVEEAPPVPAGQNGGMEGGIPGGTGTGAATGFIRELLRSAAPAPQPPPAVVQREPAPARITRIVVGGTVQEAKVVFKPIPVYPALARQARVSGVVKLEALIGVDGRVRELRVANGHPMLIPAAIEAVQRWLYSPTLLNGVPVEVSTVISVTFTLN